MIHITASLAEVAFEVDVSKEEPYCSSVIAKYSETPGEVFAHDIRLFMTPDQMRELCDAINGALNHSIFAEAPEVEPLEAK